ncbi:MAG: UDP-N-acetylmuramoyl-L-alanine--D-glutamate ligase [Planctomycetes bacterium]|nr:UDP-N-acetylmuramoyl-L-alanine--D-glutamate ligase [Planctomycetota bacterium]
MPFTDRVLDPRELRGLRAVVMGLGRFGGGVAVARHLCLHGARVLVTDGKGPEALASSIAALRGLPIEYRLGGHLLDDFVTAGLVVPSPAVPRDHPVLRAAAAAGVPLETEMNLFLKRCRGRILAVTGSNGKSTTAAILGQIAASAPGRSFLGGNIGRSLLGDLDAIVPGSPVVIEISNFQLEDLPAGFSGWAVGVLTTLSPNHLDRQTLAAYYASKRRILEPGPAPNVAVIDPDDPIVATWLPSKRAIVHFGTRRGSSPAVWIDGDRVVGDVAGRHEILFARDDLVVPGDFNLRNACAAAAAALAAGIDRRAILEGVRAFRALPHRLERVCTACGVPFYNDSIATNPESVIVGLRAVSPGAVLIAGGHDKGVSYDELADEILRRARGLVLIGAAAAKIEDAVARSRERLAAGGETPAALPVAREATLEGAVERAWAMASPGGRVLLSPACASYDMFSDFTERGARFRIAAAELAAREGP